ncbi:MAG TPA: Ig-like domain-containing protein [Patescibacteria group bacterium]|nr:Ig-like domain-containing protein [Patescibacteria group bacterium]
MRKVASAALAIPVLALVYLPLLARRRVAARIGLLASVGVIVLGAAFGLSRPVPTTASRPSVPITAVADEAFRSIAAATDLRAAVDITFSEAMDPFSVAHALSVAPANTVELAWNVERTILTIRPTSHWAAGVSHTLSVAPGALSAAGRPMSGPVRAAFVTRSVTTGRIVAADAARNPASLSSAVRVTFDRPLATSAVRAAIRLSPAVAGTLVAEPSAAANAVAARSTGSDTATVFSFWPTTPFAPGTTYRMAFEALADLDGAAVVVEPLQFTTSAAPAVVRFRPADGTRRIDRRQQISVRLSQPMTHRTTRAAFRVTADGAAVAGTLRFAEGGTVLVFTPATMLPAAAVVIVRLEASATSVHGVALRAAVQATFTTVPAPARVSRPAPPRPTPKPTTAIPRPSAGGAVGGGSWGSVETYYLRLMNCTRTGGWVTSTGACSSPGGRGVAALTLDAGISSKVSRPYARRLAVGNLCTHFSGGNPGDRLRGAGYTSYIWAENLGCRSGSPMSAVLGSHLFFQSEKSYLGGHYVNLMNAKYDRVGIGVWVSGGRVRLVVDFYHPR